MNDVQAKRFAIDFVTAKTQVALVVEAYDTLVASRASLTSLWNGQSSAVWTSDGKSVALANVVAAKYDAAVKWLDDLETVLTDAAENLRLAIDSTEKLDESQREAYRAQLDKILGDRSSEI